MFSIESIKKLTRQLFPTGRAFDYPEGGDLDKLMSGLIESEKRATDDVNSILYQILPDNDNFTAEDATKWENRLGMINGTGVLLSDRKAAIIRKMNHPGDIKARQSWDYLQNSLQTAGFDVYVYENLSEIPILGEVVQSGQVQSGQVQSGSAPFIFKVVNSLDAAIDREFVVSTDYRSTFVIGGPTFGSSSNVTEARETEFRQLILKLKPAQTVAFLYVDYIGINAFKKRVELFGGLVEALDCLSAELSFLENNELKPSIMLTANGYGVGKLYSVIGNKAATDLEWTRGTTATRINSIGNIETVAIDTPRINYSINENYPQRTNLLIDSEDLTLWPNATTIVDSNVVNAPDGTLTADRLTSTVNTSARVVQNITSIYGNNTYTVSVYEKDDGSNVARLGFFSSETNLVRVRFEFSTETLSITQGGAYISDSNFEIDVDGWYRIWFTFTTLATVTTPQIQLNRGGVNESAFYWGAQLEKGIEATEYIPTNGTAVTTPLVMNCPSILLEPQRTNFVPSSNDFTTWTIYNSILTPNIATSLDGTLNGSKLIATIDDTHHILYHPTAKWDTTKKSFSLFVEANEYSKIYIANGSTAYAAWFDLGSGIVEGVGGGFIGKIKDYKNGWFKITAIYTASLVQVISIGLYQTFTGNRLVDRKFIGDGVSGVNIFESQLEDGGFDTSSIRTSGATVTRLKDLYDRNNVYTNNLITSNGGSWLVDLTNNTVKTRDAIGGGLTLDTNTGGKTNGLEISNTNGTDRFSLSKYVATVLTTLYTTTTDDCKALFNWDGVLLNIYENGVQVVTDEPFTITAMEFLQGNCIDQSYELKQEILTSEPLTHEEAIQITTL